MDPVWLNKQVLQLLHDSYSSMTLELKYIAETNLIGVTMQYCITH